MTAIDPYGAVDFITVVITVIDMTIGSPYDADNNEVVERDEVIAAIKDYFNGLITREETIEVIKLYFLQRSHWRRRRASWRSAAVDSIHAHFSKTARLSVGAPDHLGGRLTHHRLNSVRRFRQRANGSSPISSGAFHTCGLHEDGTVACWGAELGDRAPPYGEVGFGQTDPPTGEVFVAISSGGVHTCGIREDGTPVCWGSDRDGQSSPPEDEQVTQIASGGYHTCGLREDGTAVCWGPEPFSTTFEGWQETPDEKFVALDAASGYTCGLREDGSPICWGSWSDLVFIGQYPDRFQRLTTISAGGYNGCGLWVNGTLSCWGYSRESHPKSQKFVAASSGPYHTCAIRKDDMTLVCWGLDHYGQSSSPIGEMFVGPEPEPERPTAPTAHLTSISGGGEHACGLDSDGVVHCWGNNDYHRSTPPAGEKFLAVSAGDEHTCGVRQDGSIACWGKDDYGQASPPEGKTFTDVSSGRFLTCALRQDGSAACWGYALGDDVSPPQGEQFTSVSSGAYHACGLRHNGSAVCWGNSTWDQISPPVGKTFKTISSGRSHTCALQADGTPVCWGDDADGQASLPDGER